MFKRQGGAEEGGEWMGMKTYLSSANYRRGVEEKGAFRTRARAWLV